MPVQATKLLIGLLLVLSTNACASSDKSDNYNYISYPLQIAYIPPIELDLTQNKNGTIAYTLNCVTVSAEVLVIVEAGRGDALHNAEHYEYANTKCLSLGNTIATGVLHIPPTSLTGSPFFVSMQINPNTPQRGAQTGKIVAMFLVGQNKQLALQMT